MPTHIRLWRLGVVLGLSLGFMTMGRPVLAMGPFLDLAEPFTDLGHVRAATVRQQADLSRQRRQVGAGLLERAATLRERPHPAAQRPDVSHVIDHEDRQCGGQPEQDRRPRQGFD